jgi:glycine/D-amino acid oxidase-like deaminating enzyme
MDLRTHYPFSLLQYGLIRSYPSLKKNIRTEVAIIGAGISGALMAWHLQKEGIPSVVVDKRHAATGSTAASTSLIQYEIDTPLYKLIELVGEKNALRSYELCRQAIGNLKKVCREVKNEENFHEKCSLRFAANPKHVPSLKKEYVLRKEHGFKVELLTASDVKKDFHFATPAGLLSLEAAQLDAYQLSHKIFSCLDEDHPVYDHTNIVSVRHGKRTVELKTEDGLRITARKLVIAAGYESGRYLKKKFEEFRCTYAIVTEPFLQKELWRDNCLMWDTGNPYLYLRTTTDNRVIIGGKDTKYINVEKQLDILPHKAKSLEKSLSRLFPTLPVRTDFKWAGAFAATKDGLPFIDTIDRGKTFFALGFGGNGITFSLLAAEMISKVIRGKKVPDLSIFSFYR